MFSMPPLALKELVSFQIDVPDSAEQALSAAVVEMFDLSGLDEAEIADSKAEGVQWLTGGLATDAGRLAHAAFERWVFEVEISRFRTKLK